jgi:hypothetical protein
MRHADVVTSPDPGLGVREALRELALVSELNPIRTRRRDLGFQCLPRWAAPCVMARQERPYRRSICESAQRHLHESKC